MLTSVTQVTQPIAPNFQDFVLEIAIDDKTFKVSGKSLNLTSQYIAHVANFFLYNVILEKKWSYS